MPGSSTEDFFEEAPCGFLSTDPDGLILEVNRTFERWTGFRRGELVGKRRFQDLLSAGGRIYHDTHYAPLLQMQGSVREIALEIVRPDDSRLPALVNSTLHRDGSGRPLVIRTTVFDATERRTYEAELLRAKRQAEEVATTLQLSLLAGDLPTSPQFRLGVAYRPGVAGLEVGGDWYDAFWLVEGQRVALAVGDVVGRGLTAAATMGQLRSAVRALASTDLAPGALVRAVDRFAQRHQIGTMATLVYADFDLETRTFRYASAGHPPPLTSSPDEEPRFLWDGRSLPLDGGARGYAGGEEGSLVLAPGSRVFMFSDGLIERRDSSLLDDLQRLAHEVATHPDADISSLTSLLAEGLPDRDHPDDVCLLTLEVTSTGDLSEVASHADRGALSRR